MPGVGVGRSERQRALIGVDRIVGAAILVTGDSEVEPGVRIVRRGGRGGPRAPRWPRRRVRARPARHPGCSTDRRRPASRRGAPVDLDGLFVAVEGGQAVAEVAERADVARRQGQHLLVAGHGLVQRAERLERHAEVEAERPRGRRRARRRVRGSLGRRPAVRPPGARRRGCRGRRRYPAARRRPAGSGSRRRPAGHAGAPGRPAGGAHPAARGCCEGRPSTRVSAVSSLPSWCCCTARVRSWPASAAASRDRRLILSPPCPRPPPSSSPSCHSPLAVALSLQRRQSSRYTSSTARVYRPASASGEVISRSRRVRALASQTLQVRCQLGGDGDVLVRRAGHQIGKPDRRQQRRRDAPRRPAGPAASRPARPSAGRPAW